MVVVSPVFPFLCRLWCVWICCTQFRPLWTFPRSFLEANERKQKRKEKRLALVNAHRHTGAAVAWPPCYRSALVSSRLRMTLTPFAWNRRASGDRPEPPIDTRPIFVPFQGLQAGRTGPGGEVCQPPLREPAPPPAALPGEDHGKVPHRPRCLAFLTGAAPRLFSVRISEIRCHPGLGFRSKATNELKFSKRHCSIHSK